MANDGVTLVALNCGWFQCRPNFFIPGEQGDHVQSPVPAFLIDHPRGRVLLDTGMSDRYRRDEASALPANKFGLQWFEGMDIASRLRSIDVDPASINFIVNSHLHEDHCGGNARLPNATVILQRAELEYALSEPSEPPYEHTDFQTGQPVMKISGEHDLFGDGSIRIVPTFGHTPGHQSMVLRIDGRDVLLCADCCYTERNLDQMALPSATVDVDAARETLGRLARLRNSGTHLLYGHDRMQWSLVPENAPFGRGPCNNT